MGREERGVMDERVRILGWGSCNCYRCIGRAVCVCYTKITDT